MKLTAAIAMSYPNAEVIIGGTGTPKTVTGIKYPNSICTGKNTHNVDLWWKASSCQLVLTPLDKISDDDAVALYGLVGWGASEAGKIESSGFGTDGKLELNFQFHSYRIKLSVEVIDYLRSNGYDCGHGSIPSLIAAGVAVEKKEI